MTQHLRPAFSVPAQAWKNGGGQTRELHVWPPDAKTWQLRISVADITRDGPFSSFPGVHRWFTVLTGAGVCLRLPGGDTTLGPHDPPVAFDGADAPECRLLGGPTLDLNVMTRHGHSTLKMIANNVAAVAVSSQFGLFSRVSGTLTDDKNQCIRIPAMSLFWEDHVPTNSQWHFEPDNPTDGPTGWWIGFTPDLPSPPGHAS